MVTGFLNGKRQVMLPMGDAGSGKTYFLRQLKRNLWAKWDDSDDPIPILFNLSAIDKVVSDFLGQAGTQGQWIRQAQDPGQQPSNYTFVRRLKDEIQVQRNIYNCSKFNKPKHGRVKLIIACRGYKIGHNSAGQFKSEPTDIYDQKDLGLFQQVAMDNTKTHHR